MMVGAGSNRQLIRAKARSRSDPFWPCPRAHQTLTLCYSTSLHGGGRKRSGICVIQELVTVLIWITNVPALKMLAFTLWWARNRSSWIDTSQRLNAMLDWDKLPGCEWNIHLPFQILKKRDIFPIYLCQLLRNNKRRMNCGWWKEMQWTGGSWSGQVNLLPHQSTSLTALPL